MTSYRCCKGKIKEHQRKIDEVSRLSQERKRIKDVLIVSALSLLCPHPKIKSWGSLNWDQTAQHQPETCPVQQMWGVVDTTNCVLICVVCHSESQLKDRHVGTVLPSLTVLENSSWSISYQKPESGLVHIMLSVIQSHSIAVFPCVKVNPSRVGVLTLPGCFLVNQFPCLSDQFWLCLGNLFLDGDLHLLYHPSDTMFVDISNPQSLPLSVPLLLEYVMHIAEGWNLWLVEVQRVVWPVWYSDHLETHSV